MATTAFTAPRPHPPLSPTPKKMASVKDMILIQESVEDTETELSRADACHVRDNAVVGIQSTSQWQTDASKEIAPFIIDHTSFAYRMYSYVVLCAVVVTIIALPLRLAFMHDDEVLYSSPPTIFFSSFSILFAPLPTCPDNPPADQIHNAKGMLLLDALLTVFFSIDIFVEFRTTYVDPTR